MIEMHYHARTSAEPWRAECRAHALRSDNAKGAVFDLCRQLVALDVPDQPVTVFREGRPALRIGSLHHGATLTVVETETTGPRFGKWHPHFMAAEQNAEVEDIFA